MAGLLDSLNTDEARLGLGLLAAGGYSPTPMSFGQRIQMAMQGADAQKTGALKNKFLQSQVDENEAQIAERRRKAEETTRIQGLLASAGASSAVSPGAFAPSADGMGPVMPQSAAPTPVIDYQALIRQGVPFELVKNLAESQNLGRQEIARTSEIEGPGGVKTLQGFDKYGGMVGQGVAGYVPPQLVNQGDRQSFVKPEAGVSLPVNLSPSERDASARGWASNGLARERLNFDKAGGADAVNGGKPQLVDGQWVYKPTAENPQGRTVKVGGFNSNKPPTEFQGKSAGFGARALEADKIISGLDGKYSPAALNAKTGLGDVWVVGGALESGANAVLSDAAQKAEQAQRDFVNALLRQESGAAIGKDEFTNAKKQYFPQPFDSAAVKEQKAANRRLAIKGFLDNGRTGSSVQQSGATGSWDESNDPLGLRK